MMLKLTFLVLPYGDPLSCVFFDTSVQDFRLNIPYWVKEQREFDRILRLICTIIVNRESILKATYMQTEPNEAMLNT